jgi:NADPH:quinone reductase-like Zn-dependent oxidoreductase
MKHPLFFTIQRWGADQVIDYKTENFEDMLHDYDSVFDTLGGDTYKSSFKVLKKGSGIICSIAVELLGNRYEHTKEISLNIRYSVNKIKSKDVRDIKKS